MTANDEELFETVKDLDVIAWTEKSLREKKDLRDDYKEFIKLITFHGIIPSTGIYFMAFGPMHHARWMSKLLYTLKI